MNSPSIVFRIRVTLHQHWDVFGSSASAAIAFSLMQTNRATVTAGTGPNRTTHVGATARWDLENNILHFLGVNRGISVNLYTDPILGTGMCDN